MRVRFKQKCMLCRKNYAEMEAYMQRPVCATCQMKEINQPIRDKKMQKFFAIGEGAYLQSGLLREIKSKYLRFGSLTPAQKEAFARVAKEVKAKKTQKPSQ